MSDSFVRARDLMPRKRNRLPVIGGVLMGLFMASLLFGGFVVIDHQQAQISTELP